MAVSLASVPLLVKNDLVSLPSGVSDAIFLAERPAVHCVDRGDVLQRVHLAVDLGVDFLIAVAHADGDDAAQEIQVLIAVGVPDVLVLGARHNERLFEVMKYRGEKDTPC